MFQLITLIALEPFKERNKLPLTLNTFHIFNCCLVCNESSQQISQVTTRIFLKSEKDFLFSQVH